ncbi:MAG: flagellar export chaperone FliS [Deltaproteobacteria bacterium]|nr:flagellar export chaperone FliS [Deltaproteobacteria bacterium]
MANMQAVNNYRQNQILLSTPAETVMMLYEGAIRFLRLAKNELIEKRNMGEKAKLIEKGVNIIDYLQSCLNKDNGGEIADNLDRVYEYMLVKLTEANLEDDENKIEEVVKLLLPLTEAWAEILNGHRSDSIVHLSPNLSSKEEQTALTRISCAA